MKNYGLVDSLEELKFFEDKLLADSLPFAFDIETGYYGPDKLKGSVRLDSAVIVGFSFTNEASWARYIPVAHDHTENIDKFEFAVFAWNILNALPNIAHNAKFELIMLAKFFREMLSDHPILGKLVRDLRGYFPLFSCTQAESYILAETTFHGLKDITEFRFNYKMIRIEELYPDLPKSKMDYIRFNVLDVTPKVIEYACEDSVYALENHRVMYPHVKDRYVFKMEMSLIPIVAEQMEEKGYALDWEMLRDIGEQAKVFIEEIRKEIMEDFSEVVGTEVDINLNSSPQLAKILFETMGLEPVKYTSGGKSGIQKPSADAKSMQVLAKDNPIAKKILVWRAVNTLVKNFVNGIESNCKSPLDGMVHSNHLQLQLPAGRFAVADPNYQKFPSKPYDYTLRSGKTFKVKYKDVIVAPEGYYILGFDLSMAELRVIAGKSNEQGLLTAFENDIDVHIATAAMLLNKNVEDVTSEERKSRGKVANFSLLYGLFYKTLAFRYDIPEDEAEEMYNKFFDGYSSLAEWSAEQRKRGKKDGYVTTDFGRVIYLQGLDSDSWKKRKSAENVAVNAPVQGGVADYMKTAMVRADRAITKAGYKGKIRIFMNVHDALEFYVHKSIDFKEAIRILQPAIRFPVKGWPWMKPDWHVGERWGQVRSLIVSPDASDIEFEDDFVARQKEAEKTEVSEDEIESGELNLVDDKYLHPDERSIVVSLDRMPLQIEIVQFNALITANPGTRGVVLKTPHGSVTLKKSTSLTSSEKLISVFADAKVSM